MDFFLLGNGYDLHHTFPTRYIDFLNVVSFIVENENTTFSTVGEVFSNTLLQSKNDFIKAAYEKHSRIYDDITLNNEQISQIIKLAKSNIWFKYFKEMFDCELGWIDFEKEIAFVIRAFEQFFEEPVSNSVYPHQNGLIFDLTKHPDNARANFVIKKFNFFYERDPSSNSFFPSGNNQAIIKKYCAEYPIGSKCFSFNRENIVSDLYSFLFELSHILKLYLKVFIDEPTKKYSELGYEVRCRSFPSATHVFTFNYTNTFELLHGETSSIEHIHGNVEKEIVLGVNPDDKDELLGLDTTFIQFKKYFQRIFLKTDVSFLHKVKNLSKFKKTQSNDTLHVIGHSLDITDKDIIVELFDLCGNIIVYHHNETALKQHIKNLVDIYGKTEFDKIRRDKNLQFLLQGEMEFKYDLPF